MGIVIRAHMCFRVVCAMDGLQALRSFVKKRVPYYADKRTLIAVFALTSP